MSTVTAVVVLAAIDLLLETLQRGRERKRERGVSWERIGKGKIELVHLAYLTSNTLKEGSTPQPVTLPGSFSTGIPRETFPRRV